MEKVYKVQPGGSYSFACIKSSVISLALQCTNQALDRSPVFLMVRSFFQWLSVVRVHCCVNLQNWPAQESEAHRDHIWMKYLPSSATEVKSTSWRVWDTKFRVITCTAVPNVPVLFSQPATPHTFSHPSSHPSYPPSLSLSFILATHSLHYWHWLV